MPEQSSLQVERMAGAEAQVDWQLTREGHWERPEWLGGE